MYFGAPQSSAMPRDPADLTVKTVQIGRMQSVNWFQNAVQRVVRDTNKVKKIDVRKIKTMESSE